jgi:hypothetical protein
MVTASASSPPLLLAVDSEDPDIEIFSSSSMAAGNFVLEDVPRSNRSMTVDVVGRDLGLIEERVEPRFRGGDKTAFRCNSSFGDAAGELGFCFDFGPIASILRPSDGDEGPERNLLLMFVVGNMSPFNVRVE